MAVRADAHLHFFKPGFVSVLPEKCRRVEPDEVTLYEALSQQHDVRQVLAVGYEGADWAAGNNDYLARLVTSRDWLRPVAFVKQPEQLRPSVLARWQETRFVGLSFYVFSEAMIEALHQVPEEIWVWLEARRWLISVNSRGENWKAWRPILERQPELRLLVSHLGLPPAVEQAPTESAARRALEPVISLAQFPGVRVKLSGFYALTQPGYNYPHQAAWPYAEALLAAYGSTRLLWGSDFSPSLEWLSFPQTLGLFARMPFLEAADVERIEGRNLLGLLDAVVVQ